MCLTAKELPGCCSRLCVFSLRGITFNLKVKHPQQDASNSLQESSSLSSLALIPEAFSNPRQSGALGNAGFGDREWANAQREKEKILFPFSPQALFIKPSRQWAEFYLPPQILTERHPATQSSWKKLTFLGFICHDNLLWPLSSFLLTHPPNADYFHRQQLPEPIITSPTLNTLSVGLSTISWAHLHILPT